jgi:hypothetical protein
MDESVALITVTGMSRAVPSFLRPVQVLGAGDGLESGRHSTC